MSHEQLRRLKWIARGAVLALVLLLEGLHRVVFPGVFDGWSGLIVYMTVWAVIIVTISQLVTDHFGRAQSHLARQNNELRAISDFSMQIETHGDLEEALRRVLHAARVTLGARYGGITSLNRDGSVGVFLTEGWDCDRSLPLPGQHGVIGAVTRTGGTIRVDRVQDHPDAAGFPEGHPDMHPLIAVPIRAEGRTVGHLYLADEAGHRFDVAAEDALMRFASLAAFAIEHARFVREEQIAAISTERERIAREMHDSLAQVLGYVNTKAQATRVLIERDRVDDAISNLDQMASAARDAYADVREGILALRTTLGEGASLVPTLNSYLHMWSDQAGVVAELNAERFEADDVAPVAEVQLVRIIQEALSNVRKHANARHVYVMLMTSADGLVVTISDDGRGFAPPTRDRIGMPRFGMSTMRERAESLGGSVDIRSEEGQGTTVTVRLPRQSLLDETRKRSSTGENRDR